MSKVQDDECAIEMLPRDDHNITSEDINSRQQEQLNQTYWQTHKHIFIPVTILVGVAATVSAILIAYLNKHTPSASTESLSADWTDSTASKALLTLGNTNNSQQMLEQIGSYLFNTANLVPALISLISSSHKTSNTGTSVCSPRVIALREILDVAMHNGGQGMIQNNSNPISCLLTWVHGRLEGLLCQSSALEESVFSNSPMNVTECSASSISSNPGFIQINLYGDKRNILYTLNGLPRDYQTLTQEISGTTSISISMPQTLTNELTPSESLSDTQSSSDTSTDSETSTSSRSLAPTFSQSLSPSLSQSGSFNYPVGNCTFYLEYLSKTPLAKQILQGIICNVTAALNLGGNNIGSAGMISIYPALQQLITLTSLGLNSNNLGDKGVMVLSQALSHLTALTTLNLGTNGISDKGIAVLSTALQELVHLYTLNIESNNFGDKGAVALSPALPHLTALTALNLHNANIGDVGAVALAQALWNTTQLTYLDLSENLNGIEFGDAGAIALATALRHNLGLTRLNFALNNIGSTGAVALAQALWNTTQLTYLDLNSNNISAIGAEALAPVFARMPILASLKLNFNAIGDQGATALTIWLQNVTRLGEAYFMCDNISPAICSDLVEVIGEHYYLRGNFQYPDVHCGC